MEEETALMTYSCQVPKERVRQLKKYLFCPTNYSLSELNMTQREREIEILRTSSELGLTLFPLIEG